MKRYLALITLFLAALPSFGSRAQPSLSSQLRMKRSDRKVHGATKAGQVRQHTHPGQPNSAAQAAAGTRKSAAPAPVIGQFSNKVVRHGGSIPTVSFVAAARTLTAGESDDETEPVMGDFNGDGKKDVAKLVVNTVGQTSTYSISVLLGNGDGTFKTAVLTNTPNNADDPLVVGDLNGDGKDDIVQIHPYGEDCRAARAAGVKPSGPSECGSSIDVLLSNGDGTFATPVNYSLTYTSLQGGLLTDINGDGKLDVLAFDNLNPGNALELLGNGDGTFQAVATLATLTGPAPGDMVFGDFNGDGNLDFAGFSGNQVAVSLASDGNWAAPVLLTTEDGNYNGCTNSIGDLTGDGKPEIVSINCDENNTVTVYVNNGDGTFHPGVYYNSTGDLYQDPYEATIADMNGDGNNDVVLTNEDGGDISIMLGDGSGRLTAEDLNYGTGGYPWMAPLVADFNGDGLMDVVVCDDYFNMVYLQGYGDGSFHAAPSYTLPNSSDQYAWSYSVAIGDFNGDGIPDAAVGQQSNIGSTGFVVYLGKGDGTFYPGVSYGESTSLGFVTVADFNGDGKLDVAATDTRNGVIQIFLGNGDGTFSTGLAYPTGGATPANLVTGDFNHDGKMDLATANGNGSIGVLLGHGDGTFAAAVTYATPGYNPYSIAVADVNGDGYLDLAVTAATDGPSAVGVFLARADNSGTFQAVTYTTLNGYPYNLTFGDLNKDGKLDLAVTENEGTMYPGFIEIGLGNGDGTFGTLTAYPSSVLLDNPNPADIQMLDLNGDGNLDLVYLNDGFGTLGIMYGNGDGTVNSPVEFPGNQDNIGMALADVNGDGAVDVLAGNAYTGGFTAFLNGNGSGTAQAYTLGTTTPSATVTAGASATYTLNLAGRNGYTGTITFACSNLPTGAACTFSPASVVANGDTALTTTMTITTTASASARSVRPAVPGATPGSTTMLASLGGLGLLGLVLAGRGPKARRRRAVIVFSAILLMTLGTLVGCDNDNGTSTKTLTGTPAGAYAVTVTSTGTGTNAPTHSLNVTMLVQ